jgi:secreted trypsin-like serine protease
MTLPAPRRATNKFQLSDSGGPLQVVLPNNKCIYSIIGVTSFGPTSCGASDAPAVYVRVSSYLDWIESIVWTT